MANPANSEPMEATQNDHATTDVVRDLIAPDCPAVAALRTRV